MKYGYIYSILITAALLASCSEREMPMTDDRIPIRLSTGEITRAAAQDVQLTADQPVWIWAKHTGTDTDYLRAWKVIADGSGNLEPESSSNWRYYPADATNLDLYALHGNITDPDDSFNPVVFTTSTTPNASSSDDATDGTVLPTTVTHTIHTSQESSANYSASDLLATKTVNVGPHGNENLGNTYNATLAFQHQLARLEVAIVNFNDLLPEDIESITLCGVKTTTSLTLPNAASDNGAVGTVGTTLDTPTADIVMHPVDDTAPTSITTAECILPAQSLTSEILVHIKLKPNIALTENNDDLYYKPVYKDDTHPDGAVFSLYNGVNYRLELTISKVELTGYRVGWTKWAWKPLSGEGAINNDEDGLLYYFPKYMDTTESQVVAPTGLTPYLDWEFGRSDYGSGTDKTKGQSWL